MPGLTYGSVTQPLFFAGDLVKLKHPGLLYNTPEANLFRITKANPKNLKVVQVSTGKALQGQRVIFVKVDQSDPKVQTILIASAEKKAATPETAAPKINFNDFSAGVVVRIKVDAPITKNKKWNYPPNQKFVVMKHNYERINVVRLGGEYGLYWRLLPSNLEIVPMGEL